MGVWPGVGVCVVGLVALLWAEYGERRGAIWASKPVASAGFLLAGYALHGQGGYGDWLLTGLALCLVGDVLLIPRDDRAFQAGIGAFALGHLAYAWACLQLGVDWAIAGVGGFVLLGLAGVVWRWLSPHLPPHMRVPVVVYILIITAMAATALGAGVLHGRPVIALAAVAFFLSDLAVARDAFVSRGFVNRAWGLPLYYGAQLLFVSTMG